MTVDPYPLIRLWQAVAQQAIQDATYGREFEIEARCFIAGKTFDAICQLTNLNAALIRGQLDDPDLYERFRKRLAGRRSADGQEKANH